MKTDSILRVPLETVSHRDRECLATLGKPRTWCDYEHAFAVASASPALEVIAAPRPDGRTQFHVAVKN